MASRVVQRPPRTAGHAQRDALIQQFADAGLTPVLSTNGGDPTADIEVIIGLKPGDVRESWLKPCGARRLAWAQAVAAGVPVVTEVTQVTG